jgi:hypothetical protein
VLVCSLVIAVSMSVRRIYINLTNVYCTQRPIKVSASDSDTSNVFYHWICCLSRLAVIMLYFFLCDRYDVVMINSLLKMFMYVCFI